MTTTAHLPGDFAKGATRGNNFPTAKVVRYSHARGGLLRRPLSICHPLLQYQLSKELIQGWNIIGPKVGGTAISATNPVFKTKGRAIDGQFPQRARPHLAQRSRLGRRFILKTDISRFYHSIYTHSIPWALHSKNVAKANRGLNLLGNKIDYWVRMGQDQQTVGIPVGPDTSLVLAELLMQRCDDALLTKLNGLQGHRFIDDYELSFHTRTEAEEAYHVLQSCLSDYELALNPLKTGILELPSPLEYLWATQLRSINFRSSKSGQASDLARYFDLAFSLHAQFPDESVLQFAIARLRELKIDPANWDMLQRLLLLCVIPEPATFPYVLHLIVRRTNAGAAPLQAELEEVVNTLVCTHAPQRHSSEVANALWACLALRVLLHDKAVDLVSSCEDSVVALLALDCEQQSLVSKPLNKAIWASHMTQQDLYDEHWLLAYEANVQGWLPSVGPVDHVNGDLNFSFLKARGVQFYNRSLASPTGATSVPLPTLPTIPRFTTDSI